MELQGFKGREFKKESPCLTSQEAKSAGKRSTSLGRDRETGSVTSLYGGFSQGNRILYMGSAMFSLRKKKWNVKSGIHKSQLDSRLLLLIQAAVKMTVSLL